MFSPSVITFCNSQVADRSSEIFFDAFPRIEFHKKSEVL